MITYQIGKNGITENVIKDLNEHLRKFQPIRVKFLKAFLGSTTRQEAAENLVKSLAFEVQSKLIGNVLQLSRKQKI